MPKALINNEKCYCTLSNSAELEKIRVFVVDCATKFGFDDEVSSKIALAVDEACSNLIKHAFAYDNEKNIELRISSENNNKLVVSISDDAEPFNPLLIESPDMKEYFKQFRKGGLGIHIMKLVMDEIKYIPKDNSNTKNTLILSKYLNN